MLRLGRVPIAHLDSDLTRLPSELLRASGSYKGTLPKADDILFADERRLAVRSVLEIGLGSSLPVSANMAWTWAGYTSGGSLIAWSFVFPNATVLGIDIDPTIKIEDYRIRTFAANSMLPWDVRTVMRSQGFIEWDKESRGDRKSLDLIIDDGCHEYICQQVTMFHLWPFLREGGLYVIEDVLSANVNLWNQFLEARSISFMILRYTDNTAEQSAIVVRKSSYSEIVLRAEDIHATITPLLKPYNACWPPFDAYGNGWDLKQCCMLDATNLIISDSETRARYQKALNTCFDGVQTFSRCCVPHFALLALNNTEDLIKQVI